MPARRGERRWCRRPVVRVQVLSSLSMLLALYGDAGGQASQTFAREEAIAVIDVGVYYTPAVSAALSADTSPARNAHALIDLMIAEANGAFERSGAHLRLNLVDRRQLDYAEADVPQQDLFDFSRGTNGLEEVPGLRDAAHADLMVLVVNLKLPTVCGLAANANASEAYAYALVYYTCGSSTFVHEVGHLLGLEHDRYNECIGSTSSAWCADPDTGRLPYEYGYVNQKVLEPDPVVGSGWYTIMANSRQCEDAGLFCHRVMYFSNPAVTYNGDRMGVPGDHYTADVGGPSDTVRAFNEVRTVVAGFRHPPPPNGPEAIGALADLSLRVADGAVEVDVSHVFRDPENDVLTYGAVSSAPAVAAARAEGSRVIVTPLAGGSATVTVTATDMGGSNMAAMQRFTVTVANRPPIPVGTLAPRTLLLAAGSMSAPVTRAFRDPDNDALTYRADSSGPPVAVGMAGSEMVLTPLTVGSATVTVTATDSAGTSAQQTFEVTVADPPPEEPIAEIDVGIYYTPAARIAEGDAYTMHALIDLMIEQANGAFQRSGAYLRLKMVDRRELDYTERANNSTDLSNFQKGENGLEQVPALRDAARADIMVLIGRNGRDENGKPSCGRAAGSTPIESDAYMVVHHNCAAADATFVYLLGHLLGLEHDRYAECSGSASSDCSDPDTGRLPYEYGYVNQKAFEPGASYLSKWLTIMALPTQCQNAAVSCRGAMYFSNPALTHNGDPLGIAGDHYTADVSGPSDAVRALNETRTLVAGFRDRPPPNGTPESVGALSDETLQVQHGAITVEVAHAFRDPEDDALTYGAVSSAPFVAAVSVSGSTATLTPLTSGSATITVTATDLGGSNTAATQTFAVAVTSPGGGGGGGGRRNRPPETVGMLSDRTLEMWSGPLSVDMGPAFRDPEDDALTYTAFSSSSVAMVEVTSSVLTLTPVAAGVAAITVTATDIGGSNRSATHAFAVTVECQFRVTPERRDVLWTAGTGQVTVTTAAGCGWTAASESVFLAVPVGAGGTGSGTVAYTVAANSGGPRTGGLVVAGEQVRVSQASPTVFTDHPIRGGVTPVKAIHFLELRARTDGVRVQEGLQGFGWTDPTLTAGVTPVRHVHLTELRAALDEAYAAAGLLAPSYTDAAVTVATVIKAVHLMELRDAVAALE